MSLEFHRKIHAMKARFSYPHSVAKGIWKSTDLEIKSTELTFWLALSQVSKYISMVLSPSISCFSNFVNVCVASKCQHQLALAILHIFLSVLVLCRPILLLYVVVVNK